MILFNFGLLMIRLIRTLKTWTTLIRLTNWNKWHSKREQSVSVLPPWERQFVQSLELIFSHCSAAEGSCRALYHLDSRHLQTFLFRLFVVVLRLPTCPSEAWSFNFALRFGRVFMLMLWHACSQRMMLAWMHIKLLAYLHIQSLQPSSQKDSLPASAEKSVDAA